MKGIEAGAQFLKEKRMSKQDKIRVSKYTYEILSLEAREMIKALRLYRMHEEMSTNKKYWQVRINRHNLKLKALQTDLDRMEVEKE